MSYLYLYEAGSCIECLRIPFSAVCSLLLVKDVAIVTRIIQSLCCAL